MRCAVLCATHRGHRFLERLSDLTPGGDLLVMSFRETPHEPPYLDSLQALCEDRGGHFVEGRRPLGPAFEAAWNAVRPELMLVVGWRYRIPPEIFRRPRLGTFVFHDSLLPRYRGFSPTVWSILNGEDHTGATLFEIAEEIDAGPIVDQETVPIRPDDRIASVMEKVTESYLALLERNLPALLAGGAPRQPQDPTEATFTCKRLPADNLIDWAAPTRTIHNLIRAVSRPYPGAFTYLDARKVVVWSARPYSQRPYVGRVCGRVVEVREGEGAVVLTGDGALLVETVETDGGGEVCASEVLHKLSQTLRSSLG